VLILLILSASVAVGYLRWRSSQEQEPGTPTGEELLRQVPSDLVPVVGTVKSADADGITIIVDRYIQDPAGTYLDQEERRFNFGTDTNLFMILRTPAPSASPTVGEGYDPLSDSSVLIEYGDLTLGSSVTVLYSASDTNAVQTAWRVFIPEP